jgi:4'-phosphopantetheinyl transferase EntD
LDEITFITEALKRWFPAAYVHAARIKNYPILTEERALVASAVLNRQNEFATGRWLARQGLRSFSLEDAPIGIGRLRNPLWPPAVLGTISHDGDCCAVVLQKKVDSQVLGIGLDLLALAPRVEGVEALLPMFLTNEKELEAVKAFQTQIDPALLLFSIKESVIKALSHRLTDFIDMRQVEIYLSDKLQFKLFDIRLRGCVFIAASDTYLLTAATSNE